MTSHWARSTSPAYQLNVSIPNESSAVGGYPIAVIMNSDTLQGFGFTVADVVNGSSWLNITTPAAMNAGSAFNITVNASAGSSARVAVFSPSASSLIYENNSVNLSGTPPFANVAMNMTYPGIYVVDVFVSGVGSKKSVISVSSPTSGTSPNIWTYTAPSASTNNATLFTTSNNVYVMSNIANTTASVMRLNATTNTTLKTELALNQQVGSSYYAVFNSSDLASGTTYFVRLDTNSSTGIANTMFIVS